MCIRDRGWLYCAVVKDLCTKQIVGYAFSDRIDTNLTPVSYTHLPFRHSQYMSL